MRRIFAYFINLAGLMLSAGASLCAQDTLIYPLKIRAGIETIGPVTYFSDPDILSADAFVSYDLNEKKSVFAGAGILDYKYSQYNYYYTSRGLFLKGGLDFNLLAAEKANGRYWAGIGLRYGLSYFKSSFPSFSFENYWGKVESGIAEKSSLGHFFEVSPGVRTEIFRNLSMGWNVSLRFLLYSGTGRDIKAIYIPGFGDGNKKVVPAISYYLVWSIPFKKITVITKPPEPEEEESDTGTRD